jgi:hypothetical protein
VFRQDDLEAVGQNVIEFELVRASDVVMENKQRPAGPAPPEMHVNSVQVDPR